MICDHGRFAYKQRCQFFSDGGPVLTISWYRAPPGAKFLPIPSRFRSLLWDSFPWSLTGPGEVWGKAPAWQPGSTPPTAHGVGFFGVASSFAQGQHYDPAGPHYPRDPFGLAVGCTGFALGQGGGIELGFGLVGHGTEARAGIVLSAGRTGPDFRGMGGLLLGAGTSGPNVRVGGGELLGAGLVGEGKLLGGGELLGAGTGQPLRSGLLLGGGGDRGDGPTGVGLVLSAGVDVPPAAGLELWLRADDLVGLGDGALVSLWPDRSGTGNDATQSGAARGTLRLTIPGVAAMVQFGVATWMQLTRSVGDNDGTFFAVLRGGGTPLSNSTNVIIGGAGPFQQAWDKVTRPHFQGVDFHRGGISQVVFAAAPVPVNNLYATMVSGTNAYLAFDQLIPGTPTGATGAGPSTMDALGSSSGGLNALGLAVMEVLVWGRALAQRESDYVAYYLCAKWGITI